MNDRRWELGREKNESSLNHSTLLLPCDLDVSLLLIPLVFALLILLFSFPTLLFFSFVSCSSSCSSSFPLRNGFRLWLSHPLPSLPFRFYFFLSVLLVLFLFLLFFLLLFVCCFFFCLLSPSFPPSLYLLILVHVFVCLFLLRNGFRLWLHLDFAACAHRWSVWREIFGRNLTLPLPWSISLQLYFFRRYLLPISINHIVLLARLFVMGPNASSLHSSCAPRYALLPRLWCCGWPNDAAMSTRNINFSSLNQSIGVRRHRPRLDFSLDIVAFVTGDRLALSISFFRAASSVAYRLCACLLSFQLLDCAFCFWYPAVNFIPSLSLPHSVRGFLSPHIPSPLSTVFVRVFLVFISFPLLCFPYVRVSLVPGRLPRAFLVPHPFLESNSRISLATLFSEIEKSRGGGGEEEEEEMKKKREQTNQKTRNRWQDQQKNQSNIKSCTEGKGRSWKLSLSITVLCEFPISHVQICGLLVLCVEKKSWNYQGRSESQEQAELTDPSQGFGSNTEKRKTSLIEQTDGEIQAKIWMRAKQFPTKEQWLKRGLWKEERDQQTNGNIVLQENWTKTMIKGQEECINRKRLLEQHAAKMNDFFKFVMTGEMADRSIAVEGIRLGTRSWWSFS